MTKVYTIIDCSDGRIFYKEEKVGRKEAKKIARRQGSKMVRFYHDTEGWEKRFLSYEDKLYNRYIEYVSDAYDAYNNHDDEIERYEDAFGGNGRNYL